MKEKLVVIGNGMAGMRTVEELLKVDEWLKCNRLSLNFSKLHYMLWVWDVMLCLMPLA